MKKKRLLPNSYLEIVAKQYDEVEHALPHIEKEIGFFIYDYILTKNIKSILEIGTCLGYSTIFMGSAVKKNGGRILTIEKNDDLFWKAKSNIKNANLSKNVDMLCADACEVLPNLVKKYDLIFQDSQKSLYVEMLDTSINLLVKGGTIIADDTLLYLTNPYKNIKRSIYDYNRIVFANPMLDSTIIPIGDGITVSVKKEVF